MSCIRSCYDKDSSNFGHDDCPTCIHKDAPPQRTWVGLDPEEIRKTDHHMVDGAYHYSFKQGAEWAEDTLKERNT